jgi:CHAT domain-containing protein
MPSRSGALLEYVVLDDKTFLFVITRKPDGSLDLTVSTIRIKRKELGDLTERFRQGLAERSLNLQEVSTRLYNLVLKPAERHLHGVRDLIIVPDGVLWELPFQALRRSDGNYLIDGCAISYAPSLTVLREMIRQQSDRAALKRGESKRGESKRGESKQGGSMLLAFANPAGPQEALVQPTAAASKIEVLQPLPEAERQAKLLADLYGRGQSTIYTGPRAGEERFKAEGGRYRILHLATHGILNNASPMYSQLLLSPTQSTSREDGLLEAWEIMKLDIGAELVVLSACETARGRPGAGEGIIGLSWAFFVAGAPTVLVSPWKVDSASTTDLVMAFHRVIKQNSAHAGSIQGTAAALREATLRLRRNKRYDHPIYWAAFVVVGNGGGGGLSK